MTICMYLHSMSFKPHVSCQLPRVKMYKDYHANLAKDQNPSSEMSFKGSAGNLEDSPRTCPPSQVGHRKNNAVGCEKSHAPVAIMSSSTAK